MIWDLPTRLFHWGFATSIIGAYISGERGGVDAHELFGLAALGLVIFRLIWGFIGHPTARFSRFVHPPRDILAYLRELPKRRETPHIGHNPLGALAVIALLALMGIMALTGLWTGDDILYEGPLTVLMPSVFADWAGLAGKWHQLLHVLILPLVALHLAALIVHRLWLREKLVTRMITGGIAGPPTAPARTWVGLVLLVICVGASMSLSLATPSY